MLTAKVQKSKRAGRVARRLWTGQIISHAGRCGKAILPAGPVGCPGDDCEDLSMSPRNWYCRDDKASGPHGNLTG